MYKVILLVGILEVNFRNHPAAIPLFKHWEDCCHLPCTAIVRLSLSPLSSLVSLSLSLYLSLTVKCQVLWHYIEWPIPPFIHSLSMPLSGSFPFTTSTTSFVVASSAHRKKNQPITSSIFHYCYYDPLLKKKKLKATGVQTAEFLFLFRFRFGSFSLARFISIHKLRMMMLYFISNEEKCKQTVKKLLLAN